MQTNFSPFIINLNAEQPKLTHSTLTAEQLFSLRVLAQSAQCKAAKMDICEAQLLTWRDPGDPDAKPRNIIPCQWVALPAPGRCVKAEHVRFAEESEEVSRHSFVLYCFCFKKQTQSFDIKKF